MDELELGILAAPDRSMVASGAPMQLSVDLVDEDPDQPRREFDGELMQELADSIAVRGVITPISVRSHPTQVGRWMLNAGARRLRASKLAGRLEIPAFVDHAFNSYDQVIENEQRTGLRPIELALFVQREMAVNVTRAEIARRLGKSRAYITYVCAMIDPPDWLLALYRDHKCRGINELYDLRRLHRIAPDKVEAWLAERDFVGRGDTVELRGKCAPTSPVQTRPQAVQALATVSPGEVVATSSNATDSGSLPERVLVRIPSTTAQPIRRSLSVTAVSQGTLVRVVTDCAPANREMVFVTSPEGRDRRQVAMADLHSLGLQSVERFASL